MSPQPTATPAAEFDPATFTPPVDLDAPLYSEADVADVLAPHIAAGHLRPHPFAPHAWTGRTPDGASVYVHGQPRCGGGRVVVQVGATDDRDDWGQTLLHASPGWALDVLVSRVLGADHAAVAA